MFEKQACKGAFSCQPHQPIMTTEHSQRSKVFDFSRGKKTGWFWKTFVAQQRTNSQLNSHMALAGYRTRFTLVRGKGFTHNPTIPTIKNLQDGNKLTLLKTNFSSWASSTIQWPKRWFMNWNICYQDDLPGLASYLWKTFWNTGVSEELGITPINWYRRLQNKTHSRIC